MMIPILQFANSLQGVFGVDDALLVQGGIAAGSALLGGLFGGDDEAKKLQEEVLRERIQFAKGLRRRAEGGFTASESQNLLANAQPRLNQIAANVSARGLGQSGAGAQVLSQATGDVFQQAQNQAAALLPGALAGSSQAAGQLASIEAQENQAFFDAIGGFARNFAILQGMGGLGNSPELADTADLLFQNLDAIKGGFAAQVG